MSETFTPPLTSKETAGQRSRHASRHVRDPRAVMHAGIAYPRWRRKRSRHSRRMRNPQFYVFGKRHMCQCSRVLLWFSFLVVFNRHWSGYVLAYHWIKVNALSINANSLMWALFLVDVLTRDWCGHMLACHLIFSKAISFNTNSRNKHWHVILSSLWRIVTFRRLQHILASPCHFSSELLKSHIGILT